MRHKNKRKIVIWNMTYGCNYNCAECFQVADKNKHPTEQVILKIVDSLVENFGENCLLKLTGGEIFSIPHFSKNIIPYIMKNSNFNITTTTNFSASISTYEKFIDLTKSRLERISVSWHYQFFTVSEFVEKIKELKRVLNKKRLKATKVKVNLILMPKIFSDLKLISKKLKNIEDIIIHFQIFRVSKFGRRFYNYTQEEKKVINDLIQDFSPLGFNDKRHFQGRKCSAGMNYFVVNPDGDVFTCHEAYELEKNGKYCLGNLVDGTFYPLNECFFCPFEYCTVPTVALKDIVEIKKPSCKQ